MPMYYYSCDYVSRVINSCNLLWSLRIISQTGFNWYCNISVHDFRESTKYAVLTDRLYFQIQDDAIERGKGRLQMPPTMKCREDVEHLLSDDSEIDGYEQHNYVFTDISYNLPDRVSGCDVRYFLNPAIK